MSRDLIDRSKGKWHEILVRSGIDETYLTRKQGPCPICGGKTRFRFDDKDGSGSWICNRCGPGYGVHLIQNVFRISIADALSVVERYASIATSKPNASKATSKEPLLQAKKIWDAACQGADHVTRYLAGRGLDESIISAATSIRGVDRLLYLDEDGSFYGRFPGMVSVIQNNSGKPTGIHRTFLTSAGQKAGVPCPKKILGTFSQGCAVRLSPVESVIGIAEGIETALSAWQLFGIPTWATLTSGGLEHWQPPEGVREIHVFGDNDLSFSGQAAAFVVAKRLRNKGHEVLVRIPEQAGSDWNDVLRDARAKVAGT